VGWTRRERKDKAYLKNCHHCDKDIDTRPPKEFFSMARNTGGSWRKRIYFHEECFEEVAGTQYFQALEPPKLEIREELVDAAIETGNDIKVMQTSSLPPPVTLREVEKELEAIAQMKSEKAHPNPARRCHYCYGEAQHVSDVGDPVCKGCWEQVKGKM
jgi:hypothetical protein